MRLTRHLISGFAQLFVIRHLLADFARLATLLCRSQGALAAEHLLLRKQLARFQERKVKPHRATDATRFLMALLGRFLDWRSALVVVKPDNLPDRFRPGRRPDPKPRGMTFVPNHAEAMVACDFFVVVTARCRILYVFVVMEVGTVGHEAGPHAPG
jgi:hypothetical protein